MVYLDNAGTTKPLDECLKIYSEYQNEKFFNPSALYHPALELFDEIKTTRDNICKMLKGKGKMIFTSSGSESDNLAIFGSKKPKNSRIIVSASEHPAVFNAAMELKQRGYDVIFCPVDTSGRVIEKDFAEIVNENTSFISVMHVNNETGSVNDIKKLCSIAKRINPDVIFHSDGVQAYGKLPFRLDGNVDMYSVSAHKIGALKGTGALIKKKKLVLQPYIWGGGQESGLRSGTENVYGIKAFSLAAKAHCSDGGREKSWEYVRGLQKRLWQLLDKELFVRISPEEGSPYILSVAAKGVRGETILHMCDDEGLIIGTGSACSSNAAKRHSRVMQACGLAPELIDGVLRISFCTHNTAEEIEEAAGILNRVVRADSEMMK